MPRTGKGARRAPGWGEWFWSREGCDRKGDVAVFASDPGWTDAELEKIAHLLGQHFEVGEVKRDYIEEFGVFTTALFICLGAYFTAFLTKMGHLHALSLHNRLARMFARKWKAWSKDPAFGIGVINLIGTVHGVQVETEVRSKSESIVLEAARTWHAEVLALVERVLGAYDPAQVRLICIEYSQPLHHWVIERIEMTDGRVLRDALPAPA